MRNLTIIYRFSGGIYRSGQRNTRNADGAPRFSNGACLLRRHRRRIKGIYRQSTEFLANLPISRLLGARQSSGNRKVVPPNRKGAGRNRQISGGIMTIEGSRPYTIMMPMTAIITNMKLIPPMMIAAEAPI